MCDKIRAVYFGKNNGVVNQRVYSAQAAQTRTNSNTSIALYFYNTKEEVDRFIEICGKINKDTMLDVFF